MRDGGVEMQEASAGKAARRGRPSTDVSRHTIRDLLGAAQATLVSKTVRETTIREIATAAGTNESLIGYYFGGKEGLMIALLQESLKDHPNRRPDEIAAECIAQQSILPLIDELLGFYETHPSLVRMTLSEVMFGSSEIKSLCQKKYSQDTPIFIGFVVSEMIDSGIYASECDADFVVVSIMSMILVPNVLQMLAPTISERLKSTEWARYIAGMIDLAARPQSWSALEKQA
jgi:AcrR family transcriptional regulator